MIHNRSHRIAVKVGVTVLAASAMLLTGCSSAPEPEDTSAPQSPAPAEEDADPAPGEGITISSAEDRKEITGNPETFTGDVSVLMLFGDDDDSAVRPGRVAFAPGARTAWHTHPAGQRLIITEGAGWVQEWGQDRTPVQEGDVVVFAPGVKHWHGATADQPMTHIAIAESVDGTDVNWMEHVTDAQYQDAGT